jgi:hypothetical protein
MHIEARLFEFLTAFFILSAVVYGVLTGLFQYGGVEWAGTTALVLTSGLTLITGTFFRFVARRLDTRPEDYEDAEISDGAGELGFYSPHSWWPVAIALSASAAVADRRGRLLRALDGCRPRFRVLHRPRKALTPKGHNRDNSSPGDRAVRFVRAVNLGSVAGARSTAPQM